MSKVTPEEVLRSVAECINSGNLDSLMMLYESDACFASQLFFAIIGAQVDLRGVNLNVLYLSGIVVAIAVATKVVGCGLPSIIFLKDKTKAFRVGIGMVSRGEVGLIVAGVGVSTGALTSDTYTTVIIMVALTTIITPVWLKKSYSNESNLTAQPT
jgi:Kef-type K+ transport system membrane component KefB